MCTNVSSAVIKGENVIISARYVLRNKPEDLSSMRQPILQAFTQFLNLLGLVQVYLYWYMVVLRWACDLSSNSFRFLFCCYIQWQI